MAARNRPRGSLARDDAPDAHEERTMWNTIVNDLRKLKDIHTRAAEVAKEQVELELKMGRSPTVKEIDELQELYREGVRLAEDEQKMLDEEPSDVIKNIGILTALRSASEMEPTRLPTSAKPRNPKRQKLDNDGVIDSPAASPNAAAAVNRLKGQSTVRSVSVPPKTETPVKIEEGQEGSRGPAGERAGKFFVGAEVAYKQAHKRDDGSEWIQCNITAIMDGPNKKRFYEVQDPEPDESSGVSQNYKATAKDLIAIPAADTALPEFSVGKHVLAKYPETTTFYRAEVTGIKRDKDVYRLNFEDDAGVEMEVPRRYVLEFSGK